MTVLVNPSLGIGEIIGPTVKAFGERHGLCANEVSKLILGRKLVYRGWMLEATHLMARSQIQTS